MDSSCRYGVSQTPEVGSVNPKGTVDLVDDRNFVGLYAQSRYHLTSNANLLGLRWNTRMNPRRNAGQQQRRRDDRAGQPGHQPIQRFWARSGGPANRKWPDQYSDSSCQRR
jgi:hypothetical protein